MATKKTTPATKKPTSPKITRSDTINNLTKKMNFSAEWTIGDKDYGEGQQMYWQSSSDTSEPKKWGDKKYKKNNPAGESSTNIGKKASSKTFAKLNFSDYYPVSSKYLRWIHIGIRGKRKNYDKKEKKKKVKVNPTWSSYSEKSYHLLVPQKPINPIEVSRNSETTNECTFSWELSPQDSVTQCFYDFQWESILVQNSSYKRASDIEDAEWTKRLPKTQTSVLASEQDPGYTNINGTKIKFTNTTYGCFGSVIPGETTGSTVITEDPSLFASETHTYTRYVRVRARGPAGNSGWAYGEFVYARAPKVADEKLDASFDNDESTGGYILYIDSSVDSSFRYPIDLVTHQYLITTPRCRVIEQTSTLGYYYYKYELFCPEGETWDDVPAMKGGGKTFTYIPPLASGLENKMIFVKALTEHDGHTTESSAKMVSKRARMFHPVKYIGVLSMPEGLEISNLDPESFSMTVSATNTSGVENSYLAVYYRTSSAAEDAIHMCGIIPYDRSSTTVFVPDWTAEPIDIGVRAFVCDYQTRDHLYDWSLVGDPLMQSPRIQWKGGEIPAPPELNDLTSPSTGVINVSWKWDAQSFVQYDTVELSWSDQENAWESTNGPSTYEVPNTHAGFWNISGLSMGTWHVKIRFIKTNGDARTYGAYSPTKTIKLVSAPTTPNLRVSPSLITDEGAVTCTWVYSSTDGSKQQRAEICTATVNDSGVVTSYGPVIARTDTEESVTISTKGDTWSWGDGEKVYLCVRVISSENQISTGWDENANQLSKGWSKPVPIQIANLPGEPELTFTNDAWVENDDVTVDDVVITSNCLTKLPLEFAISNVGEANSITVMIDRAEDFAMDRPDEDDAVGYKGEVAYFNSQIIGNAAVSIDQNDLVGYLDDRAEYNLTVINSDQYGQTNKAVKRFRVKWERQPTELPTAIVTPDPVDYVTRIQLITPETYEPGDTCDIYRLSIDKPRLIFSGANFGETYVDPYPAIGEFGGHRIVYRTVNGDYIAETEDGRITAWTDYDVSDDNIIDDFVSIIDFDYGQIVLRYDLSISNSWTKDISVTKYLGGSIEGDWNPGIERKTTLKATVVLEEDPVDDSTLNTIEIMRRLAVYPGICHLRTPDGSSFDADIQVQEDREERWVTKLAKFSLTITRLDPQSEFEALPLSEWEANNQEE